MPDNSFKYSLSNLPAGRSWAHYAWAQAQRFWIEHAFHEAKSQLGMAQYQVRVWPSWHHHMALVAMAMLFSPKLCTQVHAQIPLLSVRDITELSTTICLASASMRRQSSPISPPGTGSEHATSSGENAFPSAYLHLTK
ncbi:MAG: hypothetical protein J6386_07265 [Candidatus Synoicihabitans palmerolidicus]|nr:hypothetical protein [Candidatus Synoicihabitans palmerolidicus]